MHFLLGPLMTLVLMLFLAALLRWTYGTHRQHVAPSLEDADTDTDIGLLREVAAVPTSEDAEQLRRRLAADRIRATVRRTQDGDGWRVLVFARDEPDARVVLAEWR